MDPQFIMIVSDILIQWMLKLLEADGKYFGLFGKEFHQTAHPTMSWTKHSLIFRSSLSWKHHIDVGAGVVDRDYRGNVGVVLFNLSQMDYEVQQGDRIAQLIIERISNPPLVEVKVIFKKCFDLLVYKLI